MLHTGDRGIVHSRKHSFSKGVHDGLMDNIATLLRNEGPLEERIPEDGTHRLEYVRGWSSGQMLRNSRLFRNDEFVAGINEELRRDRRGISSHTHENLEELLQALRDTQSPLQAFRLPTAGADKHLLGRMIGTYFRESIDGLER